MEWWDKYGLVQVLYDHSILFSTNTQPLPIFYHANEIMLSELLDS